MEPIPFNAKPFGSALAKTLAFLLIAFSFVGCSDDAGQKTPEQETEIGYHFYFNSTDSGSSESGLAANQFNWLARLQDSSSVFIWQPDTASWLDSLCTKANLLKGLKISLAMDSGMQELPACLEKLPAEFRRIEMVDRLSPRSRVVIARNLRPNGRDNGRFLISICNFSSSQPDAMQSEMLEIYGDSSLAERYEQHFSLAAGSHHKQAIEQTHTYSNVHDHHAWFFPKDFEHPPFMEILDLLDQAIIAKRYPARLRLAVSEWDDCSASMAKLLVTQQAVHELDIKVLVPDSSSITSYAGELLQDLPKGMFRIFPVSEISKWQFSSNMLLIHGPYIMSKGALPERQSLTFFLPGGIQHDILFDEVGSWIRIADQDVFQKAELHFEQMWQIASDSFEGPNQWNTTGKGCRF